METIRRKNSPERYRESYYLGSKKISSPYFLRKSDAKVWKTRKLAEKMSRLALGDFYIEEQNTLFKDFSEKWLENYVKVSCSPKTYLNYESILRIHLWPRFEHLKLSEITEEHGQKLLSELKKSKGPKAISNVWIVARSILHKAKKEKLISHYPFEDIKLAKPKLAQDNFWVKSEINQFLQANRTDQLYPFFYVAIHSGLRLAELCGLKWDRIDFSQNLISITRTRDKFGLRDTTKTGIKRLIPMTPEVKVMLLELFKKNPGNPFVFLEANSEEVKYSHIYRRFKKAQVKAGMMRPIKFHDLRHSFASNYMMNGGNLFDLQKLLGHSDIKMTLRYAHFTPEHLQSSLPFMNIASVESIPVLDLKADLLTENVRVLMG